MWMQQQQNNLRKEDDENFYYEELSEEDYKQTFYCAIKPAIYVAKIFGFFPINISSKQAYEIKFKWIHFRTLISLSLIVCCTMTAGFALKAQTEQLSAANIVGVLFFSICTIIAISFFRISMRFRYLMMSWVKVEKKFLSEKYTMPADKWKLRTKISIFTFIFFCCSFSEHFFYLGAEIYKLTFEIRHCNITDFDLFELFTRKQHKFVLDNIPYEYNNVIGAIVEYLNFSYTFFWNYLDLFIMLLSIGLSDLLQKISHRMECLQTVRLDENIWAELRLDHVSVSELIKIVNEEFGFIFMLACLNDSYFILIQMLNITTSLPFILSIIYFWYSLIYLVIRSVLMVSYASDVYENARKPIEVIRMIPADQWNNELERFFNQIKFHSNALSGKKFFIITKTLLFSMAGVLVTYELVLLQVDGKTVTWQDLIDCDSRT